MSASEAERKRCREVLEGPNGSDTPGRPRPWWRRNCKRWAAPGSKWCWQHRVWHRGEEES